MCFLPFSKNVYKAETNIKVYRPGKKKSTISKCSATFIPENRMCNEKIGFKNACLKIRYETITYFQNTVLS